MKHIINLKEEYGEIDDYQKELKVYSTIKAKYSNAIVLLRRGDEYITFQGDAALVNKIADNCITEFEPTDNICRFAFNTLNAVLNKLVKAGNRVAICDQI